MDECEICDGQFSVMSVCTVTFTLDDSGAFTNVRMCRPCVTAVSQAMMRQSNEAIDAGNAAVDEIRRQLGVEFPVRDAADIFEDDRPMRDYFSEEEVESVRSGRDAHHLDDGEVAGS